jgi:D-serine dehydratase
MMSRSELNSSVGQFDQLLPDAVAAGQPTVWRNPTKCDAASALGRLQLNERDVMDAAARWALFAPLLQKLFPSLALTSGRIDSSLMKPTKDSATEILEGRKGNLFVKCDHDLPLNGCIKARGGVYEVLCYAERVAKEQGVIGSADSFVRLGDPDARALFSRHTIVVGSTGNLGFSVGVMARALGFNALVHMSADAKQWKKKRLQDIGATVIEHAADYTTAVARARVASSGRPNCHFVDDEDSVQLFLGYAVAALDLKAQLVARGVVVTPDRPLIVYLPCGVGGAPGGITFGLKLIYGDAVRTVLVQPIQAPSMLLQLVAGLGERVSIYQAGLTNQTEADGMAVPSASLFVAHMIHELIDAVVTVSDKDLFRWARALWFSDGLKLEPSAAAGFAAVGSYLRSSAVDPGSAAFEATHIVWTTGGALLPDVVFEEVLKRGADAL